MTLRSPKSLLVTGGAGFIGSEVAATARQRGLEVTLIEALSTPMARVLNAELGQLCAAVHSDQGVDVRLGTGVEAIEGRDRVEASRHSHGSRIDADGRGVGS